MSDLNNFSCTGRLGAAPESRTFQSGDPVVNLRVAVSESWKDREGNKQEKTLWLPVKITNKGLCSVAERFLTKGAKVALSGKLESRSYDKDGQTHYVTELVLGPFNGSLTLLDSRGSDAGETTPQRSSQPVDAASALDDDAIPF
jgi:single-strand DNA-binding protein